MAEPGGTAPDPSAAGGTATGGTAAGGTAPDGTAAAGAQPDAVGELVCSARGCRDEAVWGLLWNNPRLHTPERRKVWLACPAHREHLEGFLGARAFLRGTVPVGALDVVGAPDVPDVPAGATDTADPTGGAAERGA